MDTSGVARVIGARGGLQKSHEMPDAPLSPHFFRYHPHFRQLYSPVNGRKLET